MIGYVLVQPVYGGDIDDLEAEVDAVVGDMGSAGSGWRMQQNRWQAPAHFEGAGEGRGGAGEDGVALEGEGQEVGEEASGRKGTSEAGRGLRSAGDGVAGAGASSRTQTMVGAGGGGGTREEQGRRGAAAAGRPEEEWALHLSSFVEVSRAGRTWDALQPSVQIQRPLIF